MLNVFVLPALSIANTDTGPAGGSSSSNTKEPSCVSIGTPPTTKVAPGSELPAIVTGSFIGTGSNTFGRLIIGGVPSTVKSIERDT